MDNDDGFIPVVVVLGERNEKRCLGVDEALFAFHLSTRWRRDGDNDCTTVKPSEEPIVLVFNGDENPVAFNPPLSFASACFFEIALAREDEDDSLHEPSAAVVFPLEGDGTGFAGAKSAFTELEEEVDCLDSFRPQRVARRDENDDDADDRLAEPPSDE
jgi:hypothetical protein